MAKKILIVDDSRETLEFIKKLVTSMGYEPFEAQDLAQTLRMITSHDFALILLDILLPHSDGYEILELIRKLKPDFKTPIAFLTGKKQPLVQDKIQLLKPDDVIYKTIDMHSLKERIKQLTEKK